MTHALLFQSNFPVSFLCLVVLFATYLINCIPTPFLDKVSLYGKLYDIYLTGLWLFMLCQNFNCRQKNTRYSCCL